MQICDYDIIKNLDILYSSNLAIYGIGKDSRQLVNLLQQIRIRPYAYIMTTREKFSCNGKKIYEPHELKNILDEKTTLIIVASYLYFEEMIENIQRENFNALKVCTIHAVFYSIYLNCDKLETTENLVSVLKWHMGCNKWNFFSSVYSYWYKGINAAIANPDKVLVYQPGKVGSMSIMKSAADRCIHTHSLAFVKSISNTSNIQFQQLRDYFKCRNVRIISGVREPIARDLSAFFNSFVRLYPEFICGTSDFLLYGNYEQIIFNKDEWEKRSFIQDSDIEKSCRNFMQKMVELQSDQFSWFDYELKSFFGIDVYQYPFDKEKGYCIIKQGNTEIFLYRLDKLNQLEDDLKDFLGLDHFSLQMENVGSKRIYSYLYQQIKEQIRLENDYVDYYYDNNDKMNHFFSKGEQRSYLKKWEAHII